MDVATQDGRMMCAKYRVALKTMATSTRQKLQDISSVIAVPSVEPVIAFDFSKYIVKEPLKLFHNNAALSAHHQLIVFEKLLRKLPASDVSTVCFPVARLMKMPMPKAGSDCHNATWTETLAMVHPKLNGYQTVRDSRPPDNVWPVIVAKLRIIHGAGVVHMDLFPGNIMWKVDSDGNVTVVFIDFDAALLLGERVPIGAFDIVQRNGHEGTYHPKLFDKDAVAIEAFDWWVVALLVLNAPFGEAISLAAWIKKNNDSIAQKASDRATNDPLVFAVSSLSM
jgi:hypothetical protein